MVNVVIMWDLTKYYVGCPYCGKQFGGKIRSDVKYRFMKHFKKHRRGGICIT